jgi:hypothetical protein
MHKDFNNIQLCSYHESGHTVMAYFVGWEIDSIKIKFQDDLVLNGVTKYNYGEDEYFVDYLMNFEANEDIYNKFNSQQKKYCLTVAEKRIYTLLGGPSAEKEFLWGVIIKGFGN